MRWDSLFDDLEGQLDHELGVDDLDLRAEEERLRRGRLALRDRLMALTAARGRILSLDLVDGSARRVIVRTFGKDWLAAHLAEAPGRRELVVPLWSIAGLRIDPAEVESSLTPLESGEARLTDRLTMSFVLRDLCRRRSAVAVHTLNAVRRGTIDRVGRDHLDLAVHEAGSPRRASNVREMRIVAFSQLLSVELDG